MQPVIVAPVKQRKLLRKAPSGPFCFIEHAGNTFTGRLQIFKK